MTTRHGVEVRVVTDPDGDLGVLLQVRDGEGWWLVLKPGDARQIAYALRTAAFEVEYRTRAGAE